MCTVEFRSCRLAIIVYKSKELKFSSDNYEFAKIISQHNKADLIYHNYTINSGNLEIEINS